MFSHKRFGKSNGQNLPINFLLFSSLIAFNCSIASSKDTSSNQFTSKAKQYFLSNNSRAPQAESRKIPGPESPQCVINKGPEEANFEFLIFILACAESPIKSLILLSVILKVNNDGTGSTISCPI